MFFSLIDGKAGHIISEEAANVILIVDSVVIFTICQLSKVRIKFWGYLKFSPRLFQEGASDVPCLPLG